MNPSERVHRLTIFVDGVGHVCGAGLTTDWLSEEERTRAFEPGPFDSPQETLQRLLEGLDIQLSLW